MDTIHEKIILFLLLLSTLSVGGQHAIKGKVVDGFSKEQLAFVNVYIKSTNKGVTSEFDGKWALQSVQETDIIVFSMTGYEKKEVIASLLSKNQENLIFLKQSSYNLKEVTVLPRNNPAHRIIDNVYRNKKNTNWERKEYFKTTYYSRFIVNKAGMDSFDNEFRKLSQKKKSRISVFSFSNSTAVNKQDSLNAKALLEAKNDSNKLDSVRYKAEIRIQRNKRNKKSNDSFFNAQHLFFIETITKRDYKFPYKQNDVVVASNTSGTKNPIFSLVATQYSDFNPYKDYIELAQFKYLTPLAYGSTKQYLFILEDSFVRDNDSIFVVSFRPKTGKLFNGLVGLMYVNNNGWAIQQIKCRPIRYDEGLDFELMQTNNIRNEGWFPKEISSKFLFSQIVEDEMLVGLGRTVFNEINFYPNKKEVKITPDNFIVKDDAANQTDEFWDKHRYEKLNKRDSTTIKVMDSVFKSVNMDKKIDFFIKLSQGKLNLAFLKAPFLDWNIIPFLEYNRYEGLRINPSIQTNDDLIKNLYFGGNYAFGTLDKAHKYGGDITYKSKGWRFFESKLFYQKDVSGLGLSFNPWEGIGSLNSRSHLYNFYRKFSYERYGSSVQMRIFRYTYLYGGVQKSEEYFRFEPYQYKKENGEQISTLIFNEIRAGVKYAHKEQVYRLPGLNLKEESNFPTIHLLYNQGMEMLDAQTAKYQRMDVFIAKAIDIKLRGNFRFNFTASYCSDETPLTRLISPSGNFGPTIKYLRGENTFETMQPFTYFAHQSANLFLTHSFEKLLIRKKDFEPVLKLHTNLGIGKLSNTNYHQNINLIGYEKGFIESGITIDNLLKSSFSALGVSGFYNYSPYASSDWKQNIAVKLSIYSSLFGK